MDSTLASCMNTTCNVFVHTFLFAREATVSSEELKTPTIY